MGQGSSTFDFRDAVNRLKYGDVNVTLNDHACWKPLFLNTLSPQDIATFMSPNDVRFLRRYRPNHLVLLIRKCVEQLHGYLRRYEQASDACSVINALRILTCIMPSVFESLNAVPHPMPMHEAMDVTASKGRKAKYLALTTRISPFAQDFVHHAFWRNSECRYQTWEPEPTPSVPLEVGNDEAGEAELREVVVPREATEVMIEGERPLGEELMQALLSLCFVPNFSIGATTTLGEEPTTLDVPPTGLPSPVSAAHLWYEGRVWPSKEVWFTSTMEGHRVDLLRALMACCSGPVMTGRVGTDAAPGSALHPQDKAAAAAARFVEYLATSASTQRRACTLAASLLHGIVYSNAQGTSYYRTAKRVGDAALAIIMQAFLVGLDDTPLPPLGLRQSEAASVPNVFRGVLDVVVGHHEYRADYLRALSRAIAAPEGTPAHSRYVESLLLVYQTLAAYDKQLLESERHHKRVTINISGIVQDTLLEDTSAAGTFLLSLLRIVSDSVRCERKFHQAQVALLLLLRLSGTPNAALVEVLSASLPSGPLPIEAIANIPVTNPRYVDVFLLMMCFLLSEAAPKHAFPFIAPAALIVANIATLPLQAPLAVEVCFELFAAWQHLARPKMLSKSVTIQAAVANIGEAIVALSQPHARHDALFFLLAVTPIVSQLSAAIRKGAVGGEDEEVVALSPLFLRNVPCDMLEHLAAEARGTIPPAVMALCEQSSADLRSQFTELQRGRGGTAVDGSMPIASQRVMVRRIQQNDASHRYLYAVLWYVIGTHAKVPFIDITTARLMPRQLKAATN